MVLPTYNVHATLIVGGVRTVNKAKTLAFLMASLLILSSLILEFSDKMSLTVLDLLGNPSVRNVTNYHPGILKHRAKTCMQGHSHSGNEI